MLTFSNGSIAVSTPADVAPLAALLNSAYRGESSKEGWTTEAHLIAGNTRASESSLQQILVLQNSVILKYSDEHQQIIGCVNLQQHAGRIYLGMLSVSPKLQGAGIGRQLLIAAEEYARQLHCNAVYMSVISVRTELIEWYKRNGYKDTGKIKPFIEEEETGKHLQLLEFMELEKSISREYTSDHR